MQPTPEQLHDWIGHDLDDKFGKGVGKIADIYLDDVSGAPEWIAVTTGLFGNRISFVPLKGADDENGSLSVAYEKSIIKDSPNIEADGELSIEEEMRLYRHYGMRYESPTKSGATSIDTEITPEVARRRLRRSDANAIDFIDLEAAKPAPTSSTQA